VHNIKKYILIETGINVVVTIIITGIIFFIGFGNAKQLPVWGMGGYAFDFVPQSFLTALISILVPGAIMRKRIAKGALSPAAADLPYPRPLILRGLIYGLLSVVVGSGGVALLLTVGRVNEIDWLAAFVAKAGFGALLAAIITPIGLHAVLREPMGRVRESTLGSV
jgi:hypothetical protein